LSIFPCLEAFPATSDQRRMGVLCFVLASPPTTEAMFCIFGVIRVLLLFLGSSTNPWTWVLGQILAYSVLEGVRGAILVQLRRSVASGLWHLRT
jgi:hypothetical protein